MRIQPDSANPPLLVVAPVRQGSKVGGTVRDRAVKVKPPKTIRYGSVHDEEGAAYPAGDLSPILQDLGVA